MDTFSLFEGGVAGCHISGTPRSGVRYQANTSHEVRYQKAKDAASGSLPLLQTHDLPSFIVLRYLKKDKRRKNKRNPLIVEILWKSFCKLLIITTPQASDREKKPVEISGGSVEIPREVGLWKSKNPLHNFCAVKKQGLDKRDFRVYELGGGEEDAL